MARAAFASRPCDDVRAQHRHPGGSADGQQGPQARSRRRRPGGCGCGRGGGLGPAGVRRDAATARSTTRGPSVLRPVVVDFPIEYFGVVGDLPTTRSHLAERGPAPYGQARFRVGRHAGPRWQALDQDGAQAPGHFTGSLVAVDRADGLPGARPARRAPATGGRRRSTPPTARPSSWAERRGDAAVAATSSLHVAGRLGRRRVALGLGARATCRRSLPVQALTVHHTAGSNDADAGLRRDGAGDLQLPRADQRVVRHRLPVPRRRHRQRLRGPQLRATRASRASTVAGTAGTSGTRAARDAG